jgi:hypothetical protein
LAVLRKVSGNVMRLNRIVHISRVNMLPFQQDIYDESGRVETEAVYDRYQESAGVEFPTLITIRRPLDEYSLKVEVTKLTLNEKLEDDQFELNIPAHVTVQTMQ